MFHNQLLIYMLLSCLKGTFFFEYKLWNFFFYFRNECFCGNEFGQYGKLFEENCNIPCPKSNNDNCGGYSANAIYAVDNKKANIIKNINK